MSTSASYATAAGRASCQPAPGVAQTPAPVDARITLEVPYMGYAVYGLRIQRRLLGPTDAELQLAKQLVEQSATDAFRPENYSDQVRVRAIAGDGTRGWDWARADV